MVDSNIIFPCFVWVKVQINALVSLVAVFLGNMMWGIAGMCLMLAPGGSGQDHFERVDELKRWGKVFGDEVPIKHMRQDWGHKSRRRKHEVKK